MYVRVEESCSRVCVCALGEREEKSVYMHGVRRKKALVVFVCNRVEVKLSAFFRIQMTARTTWINVPSKANRGRFELEYRALASDNHQ